MNGIVAVGALLWASVLAMGGFLVMETTSIGSDVDGVTIDGEQVSLDVGADKSVSVDVDTDFADVGLSDLGGDETSSGTVGADGIDEEVERDASAGLCAVGLDTDKSPIGVDIDGDEEEVEVEFRDDHDSDANPHDGMTPDEIVDECATHPDLD